MLIEQLPIIDHWLTPRPRTRCAAGVFLAADDVGRVYLYQSHVSNVILICFSLFALGWHAILRLIGGETRPMQGKQAKTSPAHGLGL